MLMYRHGDVLLIRVGDAPAPAEDEPDATLILAEGEVTGHAHRLNGRGIQSRRVERPANNPRLGTQTIIHDEVVVPAGGVLTHEEHATIVLEPGIYERRIQRTLTQAGSWAQVQD